ncbi:MAG: hypothetical protein V4739_02565 [Pseudomonadota bacterium]
MAIPTTTLPRTSSAAATSEHLVDMATDKADQSVSSAKRMANETLDQLQDGIARVREGVPSAVSRTAAQVEEIARRGVERARELRGDMSQKVERATDQTVGYIKDEPVKAILIAAGVGAALALIIGSLSRSKRPQR